MKVASDHMHYCGLILDDWSGYVWPIFSKNKGEILYQIINWIKKVYNEGHSILEIKTDGGGEFVNNKLKNFFTDRGIKHFITAPYAHQMNGKIERMNRSITVIARAFLFEKNVPLIFWKHAIEHVLDV